MWRAKVGSSSLCIAKWCSVLYRLAMHMKRRGCFSQHTYEAHLWMRSWELTMAACGEKTSTAVDQTTMSSRYVGTVLCTYNRGKYCLLLPQEKKKSSLPLATTGVSVSKIIECIHAKVFIFYQLGHHCIQGAWSWLSAHLVSILMVCDVIKTCHPPKSFLHLFCRNCLLSCILLQ